jgi:hypothetical protein
MRKLALGLSGAFLAVTAGLSLSGATAFAATGNTVQAPQPAATTPAGQDPVATVTTTSSLSPATPMPDGTSCRTGSQMKKANDAYGFELAWYTMTTYFCYDNVTVTYHSTHVSGGTTTLGGVGGWSYNGTPDGINFHCYVAAGSTRNCSGNQEEAQGQFQACQAGYCYDTWSPTITESENYHGTFYG